jgi:biopolymer transport protein ExbD
VDKQATMKRFESINMIPFIDIMLVLLAIVLTSATFIAQGTLDIELPKANETASGSANRPVEIVVDAQKNIRFNGKPCSMPALDAALSRLSSTADIVLYVDARAPFEGFVAVAVLLHKHRLRRTSIVAQPIS